ncbi:type I secretion system permease/ATPase [Labrenzia sp. PHM005]|uniref:type I secretion system permease/ATPase n=1 Tax=Labrenzia sp. PHM005 TaxID=2590016 RepID=UPI00143DA130|nr:type I secretion system permease/ATPase [Labrenzia sp. PHM005]
MPVAVFSKPLLTFTILANLLMLAAPLHMMQVYDRVLISGSLSTLFYITLITAGALAMFGVCEALRNRLAQRLAAAYVVERAEPLFQACANCTDKTRANEMLRHFNTVKQFIGSKAYIGLYDLPFAPLFLMLLFAIHTQIGLITFAGAAVLVSIALLNKRVNDTNQRTSAGANSQSVNFASTIISRSEDIKAMGLMPSLVERWGHMTGASLNAQEQSTEISAKFHGASRAARQILQISIMAWGAFLVLGGDMSGGLIFAASMISGRALQPIEQVIGGWDNINRAVRSAEDIAGFLKQSGSTAAPLEQPAPKGSLRLEEVTATAGESILLENITFELKPGEFLGVVGPSGAGKSTLARIISGALPPESGRVLLDGCDRRNWPDGQWGDSVGYLGQDLQLFPASIAENIARMAVTPDEAGVVEAAQLTGVHDLINSLPDGYQSQIGDGQIRLSGGQIQRIALARAIYTQPALLVLDEPNAHLDQAGEERLIGILKRLKGEGVTIIAISQRGGINQLADRIMVLKDGRCAAMHVNEAHNPRPAAANTTGSASVRTPEVPATQPRPQAPVQRQMPPVPAVDQNTSAETAKAFAEQRQAKPIKPTGSIDRESRPVPGTRKYASPDIVSEQRERGAA